MVTAVTKRPPVAPMAMSIAEAATTLDVSTDSIKRLIRMGRLRAFRVGALYRIPISEVQRVIAGE